MQHSYMYVYVGRKVEDEDDDQRNGEKWEKVEASSTTLCIPQAVACEISYAHSGGQFSESFIHVASSLAMQLTWCTEYNIQFAVGYGTPCISEHKARNNNNSKQSFLVL